MRTWTALFLPVKSQTCQLVGYAVKSARDFIKTKTGRGDSMNIQESAEFQTSQVLLQDGL